MADNSPDTFNVGHAPLHSPARNPAYAELRAPEVPSFLLQEAQGGPS